MLNLLLDGAETAGEATANTTGSSAGSTWWIYLILVVLVVLMLVLPSLTNRRRVKEYNQMVERLRVGDEVRTIGGIIGRVTKINNKDGEQTFILETGARGSKTTMEFDMASVGTVLKSNYVQTDEDDKAGKSDKKSKKESKTENADEKATNKEEPEEPVAVESVPETAQEPQVQETDYSSIENQLAGKKSKKNSKKK